VEAEVAAEGRGVDVQGQPGVGGQLAGIGQRRGDAGPVHRGLGSLAPDVVEEDGRPLDVRPLRPPDEALEREELRAGGADFEHGLVDDGEAALLQDQVEESRIGWHVLRFCT
jgi:hypothetical protein